MKSLHYSDTVKGNLPFESERFARPDNCFYPVFSWIWNDVLTENEIKKQIDEMYDGGIRCFYIIPEPKSFRPNSMVTNLEPDYLTYEFMEFIRLTADYAEEKGMYMWLYDEGGWPSGSASGKVAAKNGSTRRKYLSKREISLKKDEKYTLSEEIKAVFIGDKRILDKFTAEEDLTVTEFFVNQENSSKVDLSEAVTAEAFISLTHEKYKEYVGDRFGKTIPFMFTDEPCLAMPAFPRDFEERFKSKYGYDILDFLPLIFKECGENDGENQVRIDYFTLCGEIFDENYLKIQADWCEKNGILSTGHLDKDHLCSACVDQGYSTYVNSLSNLRVPGIDVIWRQIDFGKGTEEGTAFFPRFASSAAANIGGNLAVSESFGVYGSGYTCDEMRYVLNYQFLRGINLMNFMSISYGRNSFLAYSERPSFGKEKPGYENLCALNDFTARMSYLTTVGKSGAEALLYLPKNDFCAGGDIREKAVASFNALGSKLEDLGIDFRICDDYSVRKSEITENGLRIGETCYKYVYIPENKYISSDVKEKLAPFCSDAFPICGSSSSFSSIRGTKRILENGDEIYIFVNESGEKTETILTFSNKKERIYELSAVNGKIYRVEGSSSVKISLEVGENKCFICTDKFLDSVPAPENFDFSEGIALTYFEASKKSAFVLSARGGFKELYAENFAPLALGSWENSFGKDFSGDVVYKTAFDLDFQPTAIAKVSLGKVQHTASVKINGVAVGSVIFEPKILFVDGDLFHRGKNTVEITVSNTAANQFVFSPTDRLFEEKEIGPYHKRTKEFEEEHIDGGLFGPVLIKFLK
ncbi:MAG: hypothetical protein IJP09_01830 [Clostridia bacterium]|nr:hypothetical protein [Clostridia bacterium]